MILFLSVTIIPFSKYPVLKFISTSNTKLIIIIKIISKLSKSTHVESY